MSSLYELDSDLMEMLEQGFNEKCIDLETGEIDDKKVQEYLDSLPIERDKKLEAYGCYIKNLLAESESLKEEENNLKKRREQKERKIEYLKNNITQSLQAFNESKKEFTRCIFSFRKSEVVEIEENANLPIEYLSIKQTVMPDKKALKQALKDGKIIDGASLVNKQNLQIN